MEQKRFLGLMDMIDGGGMGKAGNEFEGGPLSGFLNALGIRPQGYQERMEREREPMYLAGPPSRPTPMYSAGPPSVPPSPYAPGAITTTTLPPMGAMSDEQLMQIIRQALERAPSAIGYGPR
jgi:hypothetical protein